MYSRGSTGPWLRVTAGIALQDGDRLDTRTGLARLAMAGADVYANHGSILRVLAARTAAGSAALIDLAQGEVYVVDKGRAVHVETPDGLLSPVGTRFDVRRRLSTTFLTVQEGVVLARAKSEENPPGAQAPASGSVDLDRRARLAGKVRVEAGQQSRLRAGQAPSQPQPAGRLRLGWVRRLQPTLAFAGRKSGPVLYAMRPPFGKVTSARLPDGSALQTLAGLAYPLGGRWSIRTAKTVRSGIDALRLQPFGLTVERTHATAGPATWKDYEVVAAFRILPETRRTPAVSTYVSAYQGARPRDLYRLGVWNSDEPYALLRIARNYGAPTMTFAEQRLPYAVRTGQWFRIRFTARTAANRVELRGKIWPAPKREPAAWTIAFDDRSPNRLTSGGAGVGVQNHHAEYAEFAVHALITR